MTYTYDQVVNNNGVQLYNATTKAKEAPRRRGPSSWSTKRNGAASSAVGPDATGPLRFVVAQESQREPGRRRSLHGQDGDRVTLRGAVSDWKVRMYGLKRKDGTRQTYTLDRGSYDSCAAPGCHGYSWTNPTTSKTWSGVPLFFCIGKVDGGKGHDSSAPTTRRSRSGATASSSCRRPASTRSSAREPSRNRTNIILANKLMGSDLTARYYPLRLVGPTKSVPSCKSIGRIAKIILLPK